MEDYALPEPVCQVLRACLAKDAADRQTAAQVADLPLFSLLDEEVQGWEAIPRAEAEQLLVERERGEGELQLSEAQQQQQQMQWREEGNEGLEQGGTAGAVAAAAKSAKAAVAAVTGGWRFWKR